MRKRFFIRRRSLSPAVSWRRRCSSVSYGILSGRMLVSFFLPFGPLFHSSSSPSTRYQQLHVAYHRRLDRSTGEETTERTWDKLGSGEALVRHAYAPVKLFHSFTFLIPFLFPPSVTDHAACSCSPRFFFFYHFFVLHVRLQTSIKPRTWPTGLASKAKVALCKTFYSSRGRERGRSYSSWDPYITAWVSRTRYACM